MWLCGRTRESLWRSLALYKYYQWPQSPLAECTAVEKALKSKGRLVHESGEAGAVFLPFGLSEGE